MTKQNTKQKQSIKCGSVRQEERRSFSRATIEVAKRNLEEFKSQSDEGFLVRAEMDRKLSSL
jgi:hypothetical protein